MSDAIKQRLKTLLGLNHAAKEVIARVDSRTTHECLVELDQLEFRTPDQGIQFQPYTKRPITIEELARRTGMRIADFGETMGAILYVGDESEAYIEIQQDGYYCVVSNEDIFHPNLTVVEDFLSERCFG